MGLYPINNNENLQDNYIVHMVDPFLGVLHSIASINLN